MPRRVNLLDARKVISLIKGDPRINPDTGKPIRRYHDGAGLYLKTSPAGGWSWTYLYRFDNKPNQEIGLGSARDVSLADARELAAEARAKVAKGIDPRSKKVIEKVITFGYCVDEAMKTRSWRNAKSPHQWRMTLKGYCASIKDVPIARISTEHMLQVLQPLWQTRQVTAMRLRSRLEFVIDWAIVMKHRTEANPARWRNHLAMLLPKPVPSGNHHEAMDYRKVPGFVERLQQENRMSALAMEFLVLTACRLAEVLNARWHEIDLDTLDGPVWTIPGTRMKTGVPHRVPLGPRAVAIIKKLRGDTERPVSDYIFFGLNPSKPISPQALKDLMSRMDVSETRHGMRSAFRDWAALCGEIHHPNTSRRPS